MSTGGQCLRRMAQCTERWKNRRRKSGGLICRIDWPSYPCKPGCRIKSGISFDPRCIRLDAYDDYGWAAIGCPADSTAVGTPSSNGQFASHALHQYLIPAPRSDCPEAGAMLPPCFILACSYSVLLACSSCCCLPSCGIATVRAAWLRSRHLRMMCCDVMRLMPGPRSNWRLLWLKFRGCRSGG